MVRSVSDNVGGSEGGRPEKFAEQYVDIHCHCLAGVDDGPATMAESLALCRGLVDDGVTHVIATPHQLGRFNSYNEPAEIREAVSCLNEELRRNGIALVVAPGGDVRVDERVCRLLEDDKILTLADGGKYILLELPHQIFIGIEPLLADLGSMGTRAIISHPERHRILAKQPKILLKWQREYSVSFQITAGSLLGQFGVGSERAAWWFLSSGLASLVATDAHDLDGRRPCIRAAFESISTKLGTAIARRVCIENPLRVLEGLDMEVGFQTFKSLSPGRWHREQVHSGI